MQIYQVVSSGSKKAGNRTEVILGRGSKQTFIDTYCKMAFVKLYDRKNALVVADFLNDRIIPWYD